MRITMILVGVWVLVLMMLIDASNFVGNFRGEDFQWVNSLLDSFTQHGRDLLLWIPFFLIAGISSARRRGRVRQDRTNVAFLAAWAVLFLGVLLIDFRNFGPALLGAGDSPDVVSLRHVVETAFLGAIVFMLPYVLTGPPVVEGVSDVTPVDVVA